MIKPKLSSSRLDEMYKQCRIASHNGKTLGQVVTVPADQLDALIKELQAFRKKHG